MARVELACLGGGNEEEARRQRAVPAPGGTPPNRKRTRTTNKHAGKTRRFNILTFKFPDCKA
jgi:hypothetical protein